MEQKSIRDDHVIERTDGKRVHLAKENGIVTRGIDHTESPHGRTREGKHDASQRLGHPTRPELVATTGQSLDMSRRPRWTEQSAHHPTRPPSARASSIQQDTNALTLFRK